MNVDALRVSLRPAEQVLVVAASIRSNRFWLPGVVAVTDQRVLFVRRRIGRSARTGMLSIPFARIRSATLVEQPVTGTVRLETDDGSLVFRHIWPKNRTWPLYWRISERIGQLPLGRTS